MPTFSNHDGTIKTSFNVSDLALENSSGALAVGGAGSLANASVATPTAAEHATTKAYVDGLIGPTGASVDVVVDDSSFADPAGTYTSTKQLVSGGTVMQVTVRVNTAYNADVDFNAGIASDTSAFFAIGDIDLSVAGTYIIDTVYTSSAPGAESFQFTVAYPGGAPTAGSFDIFYNYVETPEA